MTNGTIDNEIAKHSREITKLVERKAFNERTELAAGILATLETYSTNTGFANRILATMEMTAKTCGRVTVAYDALRDVDEYITHSIEYADRTVMRQNIEAILSKYRAFSARAAEVE